MKSEFIEISGCKTRVRREGDGTPVLYLHGAGGADNACPFVQSLADRFEVILPDHPGFGESDLPKWLDNIHDAAFFYLDFLEALNLNGVHVVASSLGGWIALEIAIRSTERISTLSLVGAAGLNCPTVRRGDIFMWSPEERIRKMIHDPVLAERILKSPQTSEQAAAALKNEFATARLAWQPRFFDPSLHKWLHRIDVPTQIIWGENDNVFPLPFGHELKRHIPRAEFHPISNCGHLPHVEKPEILKRLFLRFVEGVHAEGAAA